MTRLSDNVRALRLREGMTPKELGKKVGASQQSISNVELGKVERPRFLFELAKFFGVTVDDLVNSDMTREAGGSNDEAEESNVVSGPELYGDVPILSWVSAGEVDVAYMENWGGEYMRCPFNHSARTYALRVVGDSMTAPPGSPFSYPTGAIIFVDEEQRGGVGHRDRVIAKVEGHDAVTFKVLIIEDGVKYLKPLNPEYKMITEPFRILGKVLGGIVP